MTRPDDLYASYRRLRESSPVHFSRGHGAWALSRHADVAAALRDPRIVTVDATRFLGDRLPPEAVAALAPLTAMVGRFMLVAEPPDHARLRRVCAAVFTPRTVERSTGAIQAIVDELLADADPAGFDLMAQLAMPLPTMVIADVLGAPRADRPLFRRWSDDFIVFFGLSDDLAGRWREVAASWAEMTAYLRQLAGERRRTRRDDLTSALVAAAEADTFDDDDMVAQLVLLLVAGNETTINLIGNGVLAMLRQRAAWDDLCAHPEIASTAVEELLRFDPPVQSVPRRAREDVTIAGQAIRAGELLTLLIGSANRDPEVFADPDRLDLRRAPNPHLGFGIGHHFCLGAPLARLEARIAIAALMRRFPRLRLSGGDPAWRIHGNFRGLRQLPVTAG